jgi:hypothetical protein
MAEQICCRERISVMDSLANMPFIPPAITVAGSRQQAESSRQDRVITKPGSKSSKAGSTFGSYITIVAL